ncbi:MAG: phosphotransferase [Immundisolibacterales bacterium]|nr:phosphotransferase [Immundisolibacterales bacterium]
MPDRGEPDRVERLRRLEALATAALDRYRLPPDASARLVNVSENATFRVEAKSAGRQWALRVHREGYQSRNTIASELAWIEALRRDRVVATPTPIAGADGELVQAVAHEGVPAPPRHVVLFTWEAGEEPHEDRDDLAERFAMLGEIAARMHAHVRKWHRPDGFERFTWDFETTLGGRPRWGPWRGAPGLTDEIEALFARTAALIERRLLRFGASPDRFNLIHGDLRLANLLVDGATTRVIDFDDCGFGWLMYDCATTVSFFEHRPEVPDLIAAWVRGYRRVAPLSRESEEEVATFIMLRRLLLAAWLGTHSETETARALGTGYTEGTAPLCEAYLSRFSS